MLDSTAPGMTAELSMQRAAFIVRACNSHAGLVEALEMLETVRGDIMLAEVEGGAADLAYQVEAVISKARAVLQSAKE